MTTPLPSDTLTFPHAYAVIAPEGERFAYGNVHREFSLASVTKSIFAWALLVAVERGEADLDDAVGPAGSTVEHLLAHASGLAENDGTVRTGVATKRIYSNFGYEELGRYLAARTGVSVRDYVQKAVFGPLGMDESVVPASPAHSGISTVADLEKFAGELLRPRLLSAGMVAQARAVHFPGLAGILPGYGHQKQNDWGLGLEIRDHKQPHWTGAAFSPRTFGHFGQSGSFVWVDPEADRAGVFLGAEPFGPAQKAVWPALTDEMRTI